MNNFDMRYVFFVFSLSIFLSALTNSVFMGSGWRSLSGSNPSGHPKNSVTLFGFLAEYVFNGFVAFCSFFFVIPLSAFFVKPAELEPLRSGWFQNEGSIPSSHPKFFSP